MTEPDETPDEPKFKAVILKHFDARYARTPWVTLALIAVMALLHVATGVVDWLSGEVLWWQAPFWPRSSGVLAAFGGRVTTAVNNGQTWRLLSCVFLHGDLLHLGVNLAALWILGAVTEAVYGAARFLTLFLAAGFAGALLSNWIGGELATGASGGLFGLMGACIVFGLRHRQVLPDELRRYFGRVMIAAAALNLALGLFIPWIDNPGHVGGLLGGMMCGALLEDFVVSSNAPRSRPAVAMYVLSTGLLIWMGLNMSESIWLNLSALLQGR